MRKMKIFASILLALSLAGCGERSIAPAEPEAPSARSIESAGASFAPPPAAPQAARGAMTLEAIGGLRRAGDTNAYLHAAREYLAGHENDIVAADVLAIYAQRRDAENFRQLANEWAHPLEAAEIADNEAWPAMREEFAQSVAHDANASFGQLFRAAKFIIATPGAHLDDAVVRRLEELADKRYRREDAALLRCTVNFRRDGLSAADRDTLEYLCREAMMPQVRRQAAELLDASRQ